MSNFIIDELFRKLGELDLDSVQLDWVSKLEDFYKEKGFLTQRQCSVLEGIYFTYSHELYDEYEDLMRGTDDMYQEMYYKSKQYIAEEAKEKDFSEPAYTVQNEVANFILKRSPLSALEQLRSKLSDISRLVFYTE